MAVGCGAQCAKIMLIIFNAIFWLSGAAILGVGIWLRVDPNIVKYLDVVTIDSQDRYLEYASYLLIGLGAFVFLVGMVGCCGAIRESKFCLGLYIFFMVLVMAGEIAAGVLAIIFRNQIETTLTEKAKKKIEEQDFYINSTYGQSLAFVQFERQCCGIIEPNDWEEYKSQGKGVPLTCCTLKDAKEKGKLSPSKITKDDLKDYDECAKLGKSDYIHDKGCKDALIEFIEMNAIILIGVGLGIACLELFGFIFAICLCRSVGDEEA